MITYGCSLHLIDGVDEHGDLLLLRLLPLCLLRRLRVGVELEAGLGSGLRLGLSLGLGLGWAGVRAWVWTSLLW